MHERSLVACLLRQIEQLASEPCAGEGGAGRVAAVRIECGPLSGVEPELLRSAFADATLDGICRGAALQIDVRGLSCRCRACEAEFTLAEFEFRCPSCGGDGVQVTGGDEVRLIEFTFAA